MLSFIKMYPKISAALILALLIIGGFVIHDALKNKEEHSMEFSIIPETIAKACRMDSIRARGRLIAITHNNSTGYFIYKGLPMGIQYDMLKRLSNDMDLDLEIVVEDDILKCLQMINRGEADILATDLTYTKSRADSINFTYPIGYNKQVIVQRRKNYRKKGDKAAFLKRALDLDGKTIYAQKGSIFINELHHVQEVTGSEFIIVEDSVHTQEELVLMVSQGYIDYTACDERVAKANQGFVGNLDYHIALSVEQRLCWAVPPGADSLKFHINNWLKHFTRGTTYAVLNKKYFNTLHSSFYKDKKNLPKRGGRLSPYDKIIKKYAKKLGWDWRLLASMIYQESRFNAKTVSWAGAKGLMQLMPATAERFNLKNPFNPEENIRAGVEFLQWISKQFDEGGISEEERIKFILASYNVGLGHVYDARKLAKKYGKDYNRWTESADTFIILKANPKYYHDPVVKHGYCRGSEPYHYVQVIFERYEDYKNLVKE
jgi:membrane-bound lytic murein transglycosylase F